MMGLRFESEVEYSNLGIHPLLWVEKGFEEGAHL